LRETKGIKLLTPPRTVFGPASPANAFGFDYSATQLRPDMGFSTVSIPYWFLVVATRLPP
jgi:hypothetical protein